MLLVLLFLIQTSQLCFCKNSTSSCIEHERLALLRFRASFKNTSQGPLGSWEGTDCCKWKGVSCDTITGHVIKLHLRSSPPILDSSSLFVNYYFLEAENVNPSLLELEHLKYLGLSGIDFHSSPIPKFLGSMKRLRYLSLSYCSFTGWIPHHLGNLSSLRLLDLSYNWGLYDDDMDWISKLSSLKHLALNGVSLEKAHNLFQVLLKLPSLSLAKFSGCGITNIHIPRGIVNSTFLVNVEVLNLGSNALHGSLPNAFQNMTSIEDLDLSWNFFSLIPHWLANLHSLVRVDLSENHFSSSEVSIESILKNKCSLRTLDLSSSYIMHDLRVPSLKFGHGNLSGCMRGYVLEELLLRESGVSDSFPTWLGKLKWLRELDLSYNQLSGTIPTSLGGLSNLVDLSLSNNQLNGSIPSSLGRMSNLTRLDLSNNQLKGTVPQNLGQLVSIEILDLSNNSLHGTFSELHLRNLSNLSTLEIGFNSLDVMIPSSWTSPFKFLSSMGMSSCNLGTQFPQWLKNMTFLFRLDLSNNNIGETIPFWIVEINWMETLDLSNNYISRSIPKMFGHSIPTLFEIILKNNLLEGSIPKSLCTINSLLVLDLSNNRLSGTIPQWLKNLEHLEMLDLSNNSIGGTIPNWIQEMNWMNRLDLSNNQFSGSIPKNLGDSILNLLELNLKNNLLEGPIPNSLCKMMMLSVLDLSDNRLSGTIPNCWRGMSIDILNLSSNKLSGTIPSSFGESFGVKWLNLSNNSLHGELHEEMKNIENLEILDLGENQFSRIIPSWIQTFQGLQVLRLSQNLFNGDIPSSLCQLPFLQVLDLAGLIGLNLSHNNLSGKIPSKMEDMKSLESMDLSGNHLYGLIPPTMSALTFLSHLNLSNNNFSGPIPNGPQFSSYDPSSFAGNPYLCGDPVGKACSPKGIIQPEPPVNVEEEDNAERKEKVLFYFVVALGFITGFWGSIGVLIYKRNWRHACFRPVENLADILYVESMIRMARLKKMIKKNH
ncbi:receptor-like protein EIX2 [Senna tora]|uniref:Receptor-like protein EIX2 n=1 Tax=Senna tora TaxID=362788 RepID=A0A834TAL0_9FABA|nr:receptor-like protein EIX2 [Senna tora]